MIARPAPASDLRDGKNRFIANAVEEKLSVDGDGELRVTGVLRRKEKETSSFSAERVLVTLSDGSSLPLFFKDLNPESLTSTARSVRPLDLEPSRRELSMYRSVLSARDHGTLEMYAYRWEPESSCYWIFLEDGGDELLRDSTLVEEWAEAARWAARFHVTARSIAPYRFEFLPRFNHKSYRSCIRRANEIRKVLEPAEAKVTEKGAALLHRNIDRLLDMRKSIIHGQYFGNNILVQRDAPADGGSIDGPSDRASDRTADRASGGRIAVRPIDWETASVGPELFDLASLASGEWTPEEREVLRNAYIDEYERASGEEIDRAEVETDLSVISLYSALEWINWWGRNRTLVHRFPGFITDLENAIQAV